jgi:ABC-type uncharacterized transport system substrate-binding protein
MFSRAPVEEGLVASLARPGGNVTGVTNDSGPDMESKRLDLLREGIPKLRRGAFLGLKAEGRPRRGGTSRPQRGRRG